MLFFRRCLSAAMQHLRSPKIKPELAVSLAIYNATRWAGSARANGGYISEGCVTNAALQMATMTKNALTMNFGRRFHKFLKRTYSLDGTAVYRAVHRILSHESCVPEGAQLDAINDEWRDWIPRSTSRWLTNEPHQLVPLTYAFLKNIEGWSQQGPVVKDEGSKHRALRSFSILPTKKGFQCSHMKMCGLDLWALLRRAGYHVLGLHDGWKDVRVLFWHKLFNIQKFERTNCKFAEGERH